jgi:transformation/transcription domain-associated protein
MLDVFFAFLRQAQHIDLLFHIVDIYTFRSPTDHASLSRFIYEHVVCQRNLGFKREILRRFVEIFESPSVSQEHKTMALRAIVNPILLMAASRGQEEANLIDREYSVLVRNILTCAFKHD